MTKRPNSKSSRLLANNWVITLTATLIGVFLALYLNEWVASRNLVSQKEIATRNILSEIKSNQKHLNETIVEHTKLLDLMVFIGKYRDAEENLIVPADSMNRFRKKHPDLIIIQDSTLVNNGNYKYRGEAYNALSIPHLELTTISWETLKSTGISATFGFECLMHLESIDKLISVISQKDGELFEYLTDRRDSGENNEKFIQHLEFQVTYEKSLNLLYDKSETQLKSCD